MIPARSKESLNHPGAGVWGASPEVGVGAYLPANSAVGGGRPHHPKITIQTLLKRLVPAAALLLLASFGCESGPSQTHGDNAPVIKQDVPGPAPAPQPPKYPPAPLLPPEPDTLRIAVISDINGSYGTVGYAETVHRAVADIVRRQHDFVVSPGDLVAGQRPGLDYARMWQAFHYEVGDVFFDSNLEFIMAPGNHDASAYPQHAAERAAYARAFQNRRPRSPLIAGSHFPFYYAVRIRDVLVVALDITRPIRDDDPQLDWLSRVLETEPDTRANLILGHLPIKPVNVGQFWEVASSQRLVEILKSRPHTIYISGHHHVYYPGHLGELRTVSCPALGSGPRSLFGAPSIAGYVQITIPSGSPPRVASLVAPDFTRMVDIKNLPARIMQLDREDVGLSNYYIEMLDNEAQHHIAP